MANTHSLDLEASSSQHASITDANQAGLDITGDFTFEAWVKAESLSSNMAIIHKEDFSNGNFGYSWQITTDGKFNIIYRDTDDTNIQTTNSVISTGTWTYIAGAVDVSAQSADFYVDGSGVADTVLASDGSSVNNNAEPFVLGARKDGGSFDRHFDGLVDEVRVWNDIRTAQEIADNYNKELIGNESGLVGYWKLNNDYTDETSNGNDLTAVNSPTFSTDVPFSVVGGGNPIFFSGGGIGIS